MSALMMSPDLGEAVRTRLLPSIERYGFRIVQQEDSDSFDNANVVLQAEPVRLRVVRERGTLFADVGPSDEPTTWFDSAVVMDYLGLSASGGFHEHAEGAMLKGVGDFVNALWTELQSAFGKEKVEATKIGLREMAERRAAKRFG